MIIDRYTKFVLSVIAASLFIYVMNMTFSPLRVLAQPDIENVSETRDNLNKQLEAVANVGDAIDDMNARLDSVDKVTDTIDDMSKQLEALEGQVGGGKISTPSMEEKTFTFEGIPNLDAFCLEMEGLSLTIPELPTFTLPTMEISWPEIQKLCGME